MKGGHVAGGPVPVSGNETTVVNQNPKVTVVVSNYANNKEKHLISAHCKISVDAPVLGSITVFEKNLGGKYGEDHLAGMVANIEKISQAT